MSKPWHLVTHPHHNYYEGRADADLTPWLTYFVEVMARMFEEVGAEAEQQIKTSGKSPSVVPDDRRARVVFSLLVRQSTVTANGIAKALGVSPRQASNYLAAWVREGWLVATTTARKSRHIDCAASASCRPPL